MQTTINEHFPIIPSLYKREIKKNIPDKILIQTKIYEHFPVVTNITGISKLLDKINLS